ncbi:MAG: class D sortase [Thermaerobacter sp.]|nr:class D sortase [Thermaerobacter sp.]
MTSPLALHGFDSIRQHDLLATAPRPRLTKQSPERAPHANADASLATPLAAPVSSPPPSGQVVATLLIPNIGVTAAVVQGTGESQLLAAPGHFVGSVLPGQPGTSVVAAHNATYFRQINQLKPGDRVNVTTRQGQFVFAVTTHEVVGANQGLPDSTEPTLALEACYPLDALYFTPDRFVVFARLVASRLTPEALADSPGPAVGPYHAAIAPAIAAAYPLWLSQNSLPMGALRYRTPVRQAAFAHFLNGPLPLNLTAETIRLLEAYRYVSQHGQTAWLTSLLPTASPPADPFWQAASVRFLGPANLTMTLTANAVPTQITLTDWDVMIGSRHVSLTMVVDVAGHTLHLASLTVGPF